MAQRGLQLVQLALQKNHADVSSSSSRIPSGLDVNFDKTMNNNVNDTSREKCEQVNNSVGTHHEEQPCHVISLPYTEQIECLNYPVFLNGSTDCLLPVHKILDGMETMPFLPEQISTWPSIIVEKPAVTVMQDNNIIMPVAMPPEDQQSGSCSVQKDDSVIINNGISVPSDYLKEVTDSQPKPSFILRHKRGNLTKKYELTNSSDEEPFYGGESDEYVPPSGISSYGSSSGSDLENRIFPVNILNARSVENSGDAPEKRKGKKRQKNSEVWKKNKRKCLRNSGKQYVSSRGKVVEERKMGQPCKCRLNCATKLPGEARKEIFRDFWALGSLQRQRDYLSTCCEVLQLQYRRIKSNSERHRQPNYSFFFVQEGKKLQVCNPFLMSTLGIKERSVRTVMAAKFSGIGTTPDDKRDKHEKHAKLEDEILQSVRTHILSVPRVESHYVRASTSREFIDGGLTIAELHRNYVSLRKLDNKKSANYDAYCRIFNTQFNIGFHIPKKDQCDQCETFKNAVGDEKLRLEENYNQHIKQKELSRKEKARDIEKSKEPDTNQIVAIYDLQAVMPVPIGDLSAFFIVLS